MKVSLNFANSVSNVDIARNGVDEIIRRVGAQLGAIEDVEYWAQRYEKAVIVQVVSCEKHPNADKLNVCLVDDSGVTVGVERNNDGLVQVVCGAPNVQSGVLAVWLPPTATVPASYGTDEPFVLGTRELRGVKSNGMMAAPDELGLGTSHDGLLLLDETAKPGQMFVEHYGLNDVVLDLENKMFTHRPDCFGVLGVARELAGIQNMQFVSPSWYTDKPALKRLTGENLPVNVTVETKLVPRFMAVSMSDVKISESPQYIKTYLTLSGIKTINNVVDITNYLSQLTGQPLHAYDYDKLVANGGERGASLVAHQSKPGESLALLNGKTTQITDDQTVMIATDTVPIGIGGCMGGSDTEVDENTTNIVLECASFDMYNIRKTSMKYGLFTDAVTRFNKGQSPLQNDRILAQAMKLVADTAGGQQASNVYDVQNTPVEPMPAVIVGVDFINTRLGSALNSDQISQLLSNVEFDVQASGDVLTINIPFWRRDIELPEDIVEEVGRLYGFDQLPVTLPSRPAQPAVYDSILLLKNTIRSALASSGANEALTYSFVHGELLEKAGQNKAQSYKLANALSPSLQYYRQAILPSLLDKVNANIRADYVRSDDNDFALFELNKVHIKGQQDPAESDLPLEHNRLGLVFAADAKTAKRKYQGAAFYQARKLLDTAIGSLDIAYQVEQLAEQQLPTDIQTLVAMFDKNRLGVIVVDEQVVGLIGEYSTTASKRFKLPDYCAGFELNLNGLKPQSKTYQPIPKYPKIRQDITVSVPLDTSFSTVRAGLEQALFSQLDETYYASVGFPVIYCPDGATSKNISFTVWLANYNKTLSSDLLNSLLDKAATKANLTRI